MNEELTKQFIELEKKNKREKISSILEEKLKQYPDNVDLLFRMAMLNIYMPFVDYPTCCLFFEKIIVVSKKHENIAKIFINYKGYTLYTVKQVFEWIFERKDRSLINDFVRPLLDQILMDGSCNNIPKETKKFIEDELKRDPKNVEMLFFMAAIESTAKADIICKNIINISRENEAIATIFFAYLVDLEYVIDEGLLNRLNSLYTDNTEINSMIKYAISWYYRQNDDQAMEEKYLKESLNLYQGHVRNYEHLARICQKQGRQIEADELIKKAQANVKKVYGDEDWDSTDINELLGQLVKGIYVTSLSDVRL